jgi:hypothetical protein
MTLAEKLGDTPVSELAKGLVSWLRPKQQRRQVLDFIIELPDKTRISVDPPDRYGTITVTFPDGSTVTRDYRKDHE